jgi:hypothetical protein
MTYSTLNKLADPGTVEARFNQATGIVAVRFSAGGIGMTCQYDDENAGLYAFRLDDDCAEPLIRLLCQKRLEDRGEG